LKNLQNHRLALHVRSSKYFSQIDMIDESAAYLAWSSIPDICDNHGYPLKTNEFPEKDGF